jgi:predicted nucleic acid-binding protein
MKQTNHKITLDSSIIISLLKKDIFFEDIVKVVEILKEFQFQVFISLITYAELWVGVISSENPSEGELKLNKTIYGLFEAKITDLNIKIAKIAAEAFLKYKNLKSKREFLIPDFLIGAHALYYTNSLITTNPRDFQKYIPKLVVITPKEFILNSKF